MLVICLVGIIANYVEGKLTGVMSEISLLAWVGIAWLNEKRIIKLQKQIDNLNGNN